MFFHFLLDTIRLFSFKFDNSDGANDNFYIDIMIMIMILSNQELFIFFAFQGLVLLHWEKLNGVGPVRYKPPMKTKAAVDIFILVYKCVQSGRGETKEMLTTAWFVCFLR